MCCRRVTKIYMVIYFILSSLSGRHLNCTCTRMSSTLCVVSLLGLLAASSATPLHIYTYHYMQYRDPRRPVVGMATPPISSTSPPRCGSHVYFSARCVLVRVRVRVGVRVSHVLQLQCIYTSPAYIPVIM